MDPRLVSLILNVIFIVFLARMYLDGRDEWLIVAIIWLVGGALLTVLALVNPDPPFLFDVNLNAVLLPYQLVGGLAVIAFITLRRHWPYVRLDHRQLYDLAITSDEKDDATGALRAARQLLAQKPRWPEAYYLIGHILNQQKEYGKAIPYLRFARRTMPDLVEIPLELGLSHWGVRRFDEAIGFFEHALSLDPENIRAVEGIAACRQEQQSTRNRS